jgi:hypothetical protein
MFEAAGKLKLTHKEEMRDALSNPVQNPRPKGNGRIDPEGAKRLC